jgi:uncharacterized protein (TIGR02145 family)
MHLINILLFCMNCALCTCLSACTGQLKESFKNNSDIADSKLDEIIFGEIKDSVTDVDGNVYAAVKIGSQLWTTENAKTTKYNDSTLIESVTDDRQWRKMTTGGYCYYENDTNCVYLYGLYYNWYAVNSGKLAPQGWRVPTNTDWEVLETFLKKYGINRDGTKTGSRIGNVLAARTNWTRYPTGDNVGTNPSGNNKTGFSALPGGYRYINGLFYSQRNIGFFWSASENGSNYAWDRHIAYDENCLQQESRHKRWGLSVRFVKDVL